ncbi:MAG: arsenic transporter, partial [Caulobacteraceae bacterium]
MLTAANLSIWIVAALATAGVVARPFVWPEAVWAAGGGAILVLAGLLPLRQAAEAVGTGSEG